VATARVVCDTRIEVTLGKVPSLNQFYSSKHWIVRKKAKDKFVAEVLEQLAGYEPFKFSSLVVNLEHNYGYDNDNCIMAIKFALDGLRKHGGVQDDTARFVTKVSIFRNSEIEKNTGRVIFFGECLWY
jgi:restriction endonuclease Mrr